jgi:hypothetical protein
MWWNILWAFLLWGMVARPVLAQSTGREIRIDEATSQGLVTADVRASGNSFYGPGTLNATLTNTSGEPLTVVIPQGLRFRSVDTTYQDEIVAVTEHVDLQPGDIQTVPLTSFCGNAHRMAPVAENEYALGEMEPAQMRHLLSEIEQRNLQDDIEGQWAVWSETDDMPTMPTSDFSDVLDILDQSGSQGIIRQVVASAPALDGALVRQLSRLALLKTLLPFLGIALGLLLVMLLLWWLLRRRSPVGPVIPPPTRSGSEPNPKKQPPPQVVSGSSIVHGEPRAKPKVKSDPDAHE